MGRKTLILAAAAVTLAAGCAAKKTVEQRLEEFQTWNEDFMTAYQERRAAIQEDPALSEEQRTEQLEAYMDSAYEAYVAYNKQVIRDNPDNILAIEALKNVYDEYEDAEIEALIGTLDKSLTEGNEFIGQLQEGVARRSGTAPGKMFTDFTVEQDPEAADKRTARLSDYVGKGKYVLVDFWASWCGPCRAEMPNLKEVYRTYHGDRFDMLSVAVWDKPEDSVEAARELGIVWNQIINAQRIPTDLYGIDGIPHIILFAPDGTILKRGLRGSAIGEEVGKCLRQ